MRNKLLVAAILVIAFGSAYAYASEGKGYREYGEEYHSTTGANFHVEEVPAGTAKKMAQKKAL